MTASTKSSGLKKYIPVLSWLPRYSSAWLRFDLLAVLTTAAVVIPQAMAYATIAGLPVEVGLYAALTPMLVYVLLGTSRALSVSVTSTIAMLTAAVLLISIGFTYWVTMIFPTWVFLISVYILILNFRHQDEIAKQDSLTMDN